MDEPDGNNVPVVPAGAGVGSYVSALTYSPSRAIRFARFAYPATLSAAVGAGLAFGGDDGRGGRSFAWAAFWVALITMGLLVSGVVDALRKP